MTAVLARGWHRRGLPGKSARSDFDEPGCCELLVERQCFAETAVPHDPEARRIDEGAFALIVPAQPFPGRCLLVVGHTMDDEAISRSQGIHTLDEGEGGAVAVLASQERPRLTGGGWS